MWLTAQSPSGMEIHSLLLQREATGITSAQRWKGSTPWLHVFFALPPQSLLLDHRFLGPACTFSLLRAALNCFVVPWRPEGWEGMSTPRRIGFLSLKRKIWRSNLIKRSRKEGNLRPQPYRSADVIISGDNRSKLVICGACPEWCSDTDNFFLSFDPSPAFNLKFKLTLNNKMYLEPGECQHLIITI